MSKSTNTTISKVVDIFEKYPNAYSEDEINYIIDNIDWINHNNYYGYLLREIYDELGMIKKQDNLYLGFIKLIKQEFGLDKDILEIGGGILPRLSKRISLKQKNGSITVYDPRLAYTNSKQENLILCKDKFTKEKLPEDCDLIVGVQPYGGTKTIIETACENNIDFMIALGDLPGNSFIDEYEFGALQRKLIREAEELVDENQLGELQKVKINQYGSIYPVIYNKRKVN